MPPKKTEKQQEVAADLALAEALESQHEKEAKELRSELEELRTRYQRDTVSAAEDLLYMQKKCSELQAEITLLKQKQEAGKTDKTIHLAGVPYKIWHQAPTKEFFEDIKKRIVPEESICLSVVKS